MPTRDTLGRALSGRGDRHCRDEIWYGAFRGERTAEHSRPERIRLRSPTHRFSAGIDKSICFYQHFGVDRSVPLEDFFLKKAGAWVCVVEGKVSSSGLPKRAFVMKIPSAAHAVHPQCAGANIRCGRVNLER